MTPSPILKALSTIRASGTRALLMGGQACVLYGAAEFSRDTDLVVFADDDNLRKLSAAVAALDAEVIAVPPFERRSLEAGHAVRFRCRAAGVAGLRVDVMARLRGLPDFETLWSRRTTLETEDGLIEILYSRSGKRRIASGKRIECIGSRCAGNSSNSVMLAAGIGCWLRSGEGFCGHW